jgi:hypothetical protein
MQFFLDFFCFLQIYLYLCGVFNHLNDDSMTKKHLFILLTVASLAAACKPSAEQSAILLLSEAQTLVDQGSWRQALLVIDSIHNTYPKQVAQRRLAKNLADSITYLEAKTTLAYTDTLLPPLLNQADELLRQFRYEKNEQYEDVGRYVHRLLATNSNTSRNFLQAYVRDDRETIVKSYYYGSKAVQQHSLVIQADGEQQKFSGSNHHFQTEAHHEIMTLENEQALALLNFISSHTNAKVRVVGLGAKANDNWIYYLNNKEIKALSQTYQLGWVMKDIKRIEQMQQTANAQIMRYEKKKQAK